MITLSETAPLLSAHIPDKFRFAPFPYFGGKRNVSEEVWTRFGKNSQYIEPFCGSAAMLLAAPQPCALEVIGDFNYYIANFWRCIKYQPESVYEWQDYPVSHIDLDARHRWLTQPNRTHELREKLADAECPGDAKIAGWWVWGQCCWIGSGWCESQSQIPTADTGRGVQSKIPHTGNAGMGIQSKNAVLDWFLYLSKRLQRVRVNHGDWSRMLNHHYGGRDTAIFFDPPYKGFEKLYNKDATLIADQVEAWCLSNQGECRIALCGHAGDYNLPEWTVYRWSRGRLTYGGGKTTANECIWFSPNCHDPEKQKSLF